MVDGCSGATVSIFTILISSTRSPYLRVFLWLRACVCMCVYVYAEPMSNVRVRMCAHVTVARNYMFDTCTHSHAHTCKYTETRVHKQQLSDKSELDDIWPMICSFVRSLRSTKFHRNLRKKNIIQFYSENFPYLTIAINLGIVYVARVCLCVHVAFVFIVALNELAGVHRRAYSATDHGPLTADHI